MNPDMLKSIMPQLTMFLAGMGFPELVGNIGKLQKTMMGGGAQAGKAGAQQPTGPQAAGGATPMPGASSPAPSPMGTNPQQLMALIQLLQARQQTGGAMMA